jgi:hypothetical protein
MPSRFILPLTLVLLSLPWHSIPAREWSDATGHHKFEGDMIAANAETIVVRGKRGVLEAYIVDQLSKEDQKFVADYVNSKKDEVDPQKVQAWTSRDGLRFRGRVTGYGSKVVVVSYVAGAVRVNNKPIHEIDEIYQKMIPKIVAEFDDESVTDEASLRLWARRLRGKEKSFTVDGVMMRLENREEIAIPLFLFSDKERTVLEEGWDTWKAESTKEEERTRESFLAEASAAEYQRSLEAEARAEAKTNQQIQMMQLGLMAVNAGITNVWQVQLLPRPGVRARPIVVVVPANNSAQASAMAAEKYPGFVPGAVRQMNY